MDNKQRVPPELKRSVSFDEYRDGVCSNNSDKKNSKTTTLKDKTRENENKVILIENIYSNPLFFQ